MLTNPVAPDSLSIPESFRPTPNVSTLRTFPALIQTWLFPTHVPFRVMREACLRDSVSSGLSPPSFRRGRSDTRPARATSGGLHLLLLMPHPVTEASPSFSSTPQIPFQEDRASTMTCQNALISFRTLPQISTLDVMFLEIPLATMENAQQLHADMCSMPQKHL